MPLISVIIPCYNAEDYISQCVRSVFLQNIDDTEFEIIIVNDGSTDQSILIADGIAENRSNVRIISQINKGLGGARNTGIYNANGEYLLFLDADDQLLPNVLDKVLQTARDKELDLLEFSAQGINEEGKILYHFVNHSDVYFSGIEYYRKIRYMNSACNKLYRRDFLLAQHLYFLERIYIEDFEFNTRCLLHAKKIQAIDFLAVQFLQTRNSITRNTDENKKLKMIADIILVIEKTDHLYKNHPKNKEADMFFLERLNFLVVTLFVQLIKNKASYQKLKKLKLDLEKKNLFYIHHKIYDWRKNIFRAVLLNNLWIYKVSKFNCKE